MTTGNVQITVVDSNSAAIVVPASNVLLCLGCSSSGTVNQVIATQNPATFTTNLGYGHLPEASAMAALAGATVLAVKVAQNAAGTVTGAARPAIPLTSSTDAAPIVVTSTSAHGLQTGDTVVVTGVTTNTAANGTFVVTVDSPTTFALNGSTGIGVGSGGSAQPAGIVFTGTGSTPVTVTLDSTVGAFDAYYVQMTVITGGTLGTAGIAFQLSLDAGRNFGPTLALGTALTYTIPNTGITLDFVTTDTLVAGDILRFATSGPAWNAAGVQAALQAFQASAYSITGVGTVLLTGACSGATASTIETYLDTLQVGYIFNRMLINAVDVTTPSKWGGAGGQTEAAWETAISSDYSAVSAKRICASAGFYNMPSPYANPVAGSPLYRRPGSWALTCRQVIIPPQRHAGRVKDGALSQIIVNPTTDPQDGFVYHDERLNPGLNAARFTTYWTRIGLPGFYVDNPNLMSPLGSNLTILPLGNVLDIACDIVHVAGQEEIDSDIRLNPNGTIYENDARTIETFIGSALQAGMLSVNMISGYTVYVDRNNNIQSTSTVIVTVSIQPRGYILELDATIGFSLPSATTPS